MELTFPDGFEPRALAESAGRLLVLGGPKGTTPADKPPRHVVSIVPDGSDRHVVVEDSFGDALAASGGFVVWCNQTTLGVKATDGDEPAAYADAKNTCVPAVGGGVCVFVGRAGTGEDAPLVRLDARSGATESFGRMESEVGGLAIANGDLYVVEPAARTIHRTPLGAPEMEAVVVAEEHVGPIGTDGDEVFAVVDRAVLSLDGDKPHAICSAHDAFRAAKKVIVGREAVWVITRAYVGVGAAIHRVSREGHAVETTFSLDAPPGEDFLSMLRADTLDDAAVVREDVFVLVRSRGKAKVMRLPRIVGTPSVSAALEDTIVVDPVRDAYEAHLGKRDPLIPSSKRLDDIGWEGHMIQGRTTDGWYTATWGLRRGAGAYEIALCHRRRDRWASALVATLAEIELTRVEEGQVLELLAEHGGVTAGPFAISKKKSIGVLLVDGPPLLPWSVDVGGARVRLLRAILLSLDELRFAADRGVPLLVARLADVLSAPIRDIERAWTKRV